MKSLKVVKKLGLKAFEILTLFDNHDGINLYDLLKKIKIIII